MMSLADAKSGKSRNQHPKALTPALAYCSIFIFDLIRRADQEAVRQGGGKYVCTTPQEGVVVCVEQRGAQRLAGGARDEIPQDLAKFGQRAAHQDLRF